MEEEIIDVDDYADWFKWVSNAKIRKQAMFESTHYVENSSATTSSTRRGWFEQQLH